MTVGGGHALVDAPGGFDLDMGIIGEQGSEAPIFFCLEEADAGV